MKPELIQENEYDFPYHHLVDIKPFSETKHLFWGYKYAAYIEKILEELEKINFNSLIEIGCGDGKIIGEIAKKFPGKKFIGTDYSEKSLKFAKAFSPHIKFEASSDEKFDVLILVEVLEHINPQQISIFVESISKNLKDGGLAIITTPCDNVSANSKHYQHFNKESVTKVLKKEFEIVSIEYTSANSFGVSIIQRLLANRFFILNNKPIVSFLYKIYKKRYLNASMKNASQLFIKAKKK